MTPALARALIAAATPPADYESVAGDLHEEYVRRAASNGRRHADAWYWSQTLRSIAPLLSYSRTRQSLAMRSLASIAVAVLLVLMLACNEAIDDAIAAVYPHYAGVQAWPFFLAGWTLAAAFGALLVAIFRSRPLRLPIAASVALVAAIAFPIALGYSSPLSLLTWLLVLGAVPAMSAGAAALLALRSR